MDVGAAGPPMESHPRLKMSIIPLHEIEYSNLSLVDDVGRVFYWRGGIYRGIYSQSASQVEILFESGLLAELSERRLFPKSRISAHTLAGYALIVEHETMPHVTYPHEWSFDMLRDASLSVLEISEIAARFGWRLKDCHPYNVLFHLGHPIYVDLGSFIPRSTDDGFLRGTDFLSLYWQPLTIWASGDRFLAQRIISSGHETMPVMSWLLYKCALLRLLSDRTKNWACRQWQRITGRIASLFRSGSALGSIAAPVAGAIPISFCIGNIEMLRVKMSALSAPVPSSAWHDYHGEYMQQGRPTSTPRFDRLIEIVNSLDCESVVELGGNQGLLSLLLCSKTDVKHVVCTDYDDNAINQLYGHLRKSESMPLGRNIQPAVINFMVPEMNFHTTHPSERFRSDLVTALAVTHHLTLTQNFHLSQIMHNIASYTRKYALVEFMPLGLWNGTVAPPIPDWYNSTWFLAAFSEYFDVVQVEHIEPNRVLHVGKLKGI
jgi:hypothetical protein